MQCKSVLDRKYEDNESDESDTCSLYNEEIYTRFKCNLISINTDLDINFCYDKEIGHRIHRFHKTKLFWIKLNENYPEKFLNIARDLDTDTNIQDLKNLLILNLYNEELQIFHKFNKRRTFWNTFLDNFRKSEIFYNDIEFCTPIFIIANELSMPISYTTQADKIIKTNKSENIIEPPNFYIYSNNKEDLIIDTEEDANRILKDLKDVNYDEEVADWLSYYNHEYIDETED